MIFKDVNNNPLPTAISLPGDGDGLALYCVDDNGVPVESYFTLTPSGGQSSNSKGAPFFGGKNQSFWVGTLTGFSSAVATPIIATGQHFPRYTPHLHRGSW